jgi:hypothetical protein
VLLSKPGGLIDRVLRAFHRPQQRIPASCNEQQQPLLRPTEGWNKFRAVLDSQSAGGAGADIDQPSAASRRAKRAALTAATAVNWPSIIASARSKGAQTSRSKYRRLARSVSMGHAEC